MGVFDSFPSPKTHPRSARALLGRLLSAIRTASSPSTRFRPRRVTVSPSFCHALSSRFCHAAGRRAGFRPENGHGTEFWHEKTGFGSPFGGRSRQKARSRVPDAHPRGPIRADPCQNAVPWPFSAFFVHADTALSGSPDPPSRPPQLRGALPACGIIPVLLSLSDDIPALSSHPFPTLLPLLATQSRVLRLARNPMAKFSRRLLDGRAVERSTRFAHLRKALRRWWFCS